MQLPPPYLPVQRHVNGARNFASSDIRKIISRLLCAGRLSDEQNCHSRLPLECIGLPPMSSCRRFGPGRGFARLPQTVFNLELALRRSPVSKPSLKKA
jgi:hypothetical protein